MIELTGHFPLNLFPDQAVASSNGEETGFFSRSSFKIAVQKDGELTLLSSKIMSMAFGMHINYPINDSRLLVETTQDRQIGCIYAKNKALCHLVANQAVDLAIVGTDQIIESPRQADITVLCSLKHIIQWPIVLATPTERGVASLDSILSIATQYPNIAQAYLSYISRDDVTIIISQGSTEAMCYLQHLGRPIDAIIDLVSSGKTLKDNGLSPWIPPITYVYPVVVTNTEALRNAQKAILMDKVISACQSLSEFPRA